jgi:hypothetical protein
MSELLALIVWLLLSMLSMRAVALLLGDPARPAAHPGHRNVRPAARPASELAPALPGAPRATGTVDAGTSAPGAPPASDAARCGVVLLGRHEAELESASSAARRHLSAFWQERALPAPPPDPNASLGRVALAARVAVLGSGRPADTDAALQACTAAGRPLLLPACT